MNHRGDLSEDRGCLIANVLFVINKYRVNNIKQLLMVTEFENFDFFWVIFLEISGK